MQRGGGSVCVGAVVRRCTHTPACEGWSIFTLPPMWLPGLRAYQQPSCTQTRAGPTCACMQHPPACHKLQPCNSSSMRWPPLHPPEDQALQLVEALEVWGALALRENVLTRVQRHIQGKEAAGKHLDGWGWRASG